MEVEPLLPRIQQRCFVLVGDQVRWRGWGSSASARWTVDDARHPKDGGPTQWWSSDCHTRSTSWPGGPDVAALFAHVVPFCSASAHSHPPTGRTCLPTTAAGPADPKRNGGPAPAARTAPCPAAGGEGAQPRPAAGTLHIAS